MLNLFSPKTIEDLKKIKNGSINGIWISHKDKFVLKLKEKDIKDRSWKFDQ